MKTTRKVATLAATLITSGSLAYGAAINLNYNFNGIIHAGETGVPDSASGFRSISDRALDFSSGVPSGAILDNYTFITTAGSLDIVHLGNRNTVDGGSHAFDSTADGDSNGISPSWLVNPDQTGSQITNLSMPVILGGDSELGVLYQISNGGGSFDVRLGFSSGSDRIVTLSGPDWFGPNAGTPNIGSFSGTENGDLANSGANLLITEGLIDLSSDQGRTLTSIAFENRSNINAGYAILAANVTSVPEPTSVILLGLGALGVVVRRKRTA